MAIHIGSIIHNYCRTHNVRPIDLSRKLQINSSSMYKIFRGASISTRMLQNISVVLKHDFFQYFTESLEENIYKKHEQLTKDFEALQRENELLMKILKVTKD